MASSGKGLRLVNQKEMAEIEPHVTSPAAIYCPTSGIVDSHVLLQHYEAEYLNHGGDLAVNAEVVAIEKYGKGG